MREPQPITVWLEHLFQLIPPAGVVLAGAGPATGRWFGFLRDHQEIPAMIVEADPTSVRMIEKMAASNPGWRIHTKAVAKEAGPVRFHQTSVSSENSLIDPDLLRKLWPNLKPVGSLDQEAVTLADLIQEFPMPASWLVIDCLPALSILEGAHELLDSIDVVVARVITSTVDDQLQHASLDSLSPFMEERGFRMLGHENSRHPSLGQVLFVRTACFDRTEVDRRESMIVDFELEISKLKTEADEAAAAALNEKNELAQVAARELEAQRVKLENEISTLKAKFELQTAELSKVETQVALFQDLVLARDTNDSGKK